MFENIHYSYSIWLSYYTFGVLLLGGLASFYVQKIVGVMKLIGLLGLLTLNVSSAYFARFDFPRAIETPIETLRILRLLLLCWLPWAILSLFVGISEVHWRKLRHCTMLYSICLSFLYLALLFPQAIEAAIVEALEIFIYFVLAAFAISIPIIGLRLGLGNTVGPLRYWYKSTTSSMLIFALFQVLAFLPLYLFYFPSVTDVGNYAEINFQDNNLLNFMPIYYLFVTSPFVVHLLYILVQNSRSSEIVVREQPEASSQNLAHLAEFFDLAHLAEFFAHYKISKREQEVLVELIHGYSYAAIAEHLYISLATVKSHIHSIYRKTEVKSKMQLLRKILNRSSGSSC